MTLPLIPRDNNPKRETIFAITDHQLLLLGWSVQVSRKYLAHWFHGATSRYQLSDRQLQSFSYLLAANIAGKTQANDLLMALSNESHSNPVSKPSAIHPKPVRY